MGRGDPGPGGWGMGHSENRCCISGQEQGLCVHLGPPESKTEEEEEEEKQHIGERR